MYLVGGPCWSSPLSMNKPKNWIRVLVLITLAAWPAVEYNRYREAKQQLAASERVYRGVEAELVAAKARYAAANSTPTTQVR